MWPHQVPSCPRLIHALILRESAPTVCSALDHLCPSSTHIESSLQSGQASTSLKYFKLPNRN